MKETAAKDEEKMNMLNELATAWNRVRCSQDFKELWQLSADVSRDKQAPGAGSAEEMPRKAKEKGKEKEEEAKVIQWREDIRKITMIKNPTADLIDMVCTALTSTGAHTMQEWHEQLEAWNKDEKNMYKEDTGFSMMIVGKSSRR